MNRFFIRHLRHNNPVIPGLTGDLVESGSASVTSSLHGPTRFPLKAGMTGRWWTGMTGRWWTGVTGRWWTGVAGSWWTGVAGSWWTGVTGRWWAGMNRFFIRHPRHNNPVIPGLTGDLVEAGSASVTSSLHGPTRFPLKAGMTGRWWAGMTCRADQTTKRTNEQTNKRTNEQNPTPPTSARQTPATRRVFWRFSAAPAVGRR